jgi:hypothetical protein
MFYFINLYSTLTTGCNAWNKSDHKTGTKVRNKRKNTFRCPGSVPIQPRDESWCGEVQIGDRKGLHNNILQLPNDGAIVGEIIRSEDRSWLYEQIFDSDSVSDVA